ncbi:von Willebrand factor A domain-containing protein 7-like [Panulirus ornatus]|uniref:von Willebrand factor A domain-containing protein 7-like n=1 Tax=Panulirus ornatus TaxID=150431 RepID=UPI003A880985
MTTKMMMTSTVFLLALLARGARAFLATPLNMSDPDMANIFCPDEVEGESRDHEWITREGIRQNILAFFRANPPGGKPDFVVPDDSTLTQLFHAYYGPSSSPTRFIKAVNSIAAANVQADSSPQLRYDPAIQGDGEQLGPVQARLVARHPQILTAIMRDESYTAARNLLGTSLHSIQKFYSHSTWVEQGHQDILEGLAIPGYDLGELASPTEDVCTPCATSQGSCVGNVVDGAGLSSGYYMYPDEIGSSYLVPKPTTGGKCSHGGVLDSSASEAAEGGINKDTISPCFSPHHHLHLQAADLAVQATVTYLSQVLDAVGNEKYRRLFDLYHGSALSICIDTTGSMGDDIEAVKTQVADIVANSNPELYVLVPYNDPVVGPLLTTDDAQEFLEAVEDLVPYGGGDGPEMFWGGLQLALTGTPDYGDIFCFTDAEGKDGELMEGIISLAQQQNNKVTIILSDIFRNNHGERPAPFERPAEWKTSVITGVAEYQRLADSTGGLLISTDKFDVSDIVAIISGGVETSTVTIINLVETRGTLVNEVPIDDSVVDFEVRISGVLTEALLLDITGTTYNLMDKAGLESTPGVVVVSHTNTFKAVTWTSPRYGLWSLTTDAPEAYSIAVVATSSLDFLADFSVLDPSPPHPHYRLVEGRPLMNTVYYLKLTLVGYLESEVTNLNTIEFINKVGTELRTIDYTGPVTDQVYVRTEPLPNESFYIRISGHVSSGKTFARLLPVLVTPVETSVEVWATSEELSARPGESASARFIISNFGIESYFAISGTDDLGFLTSVNPSRLFLATNASDAIVANFQVPLDSLSGEVSTIIITAQSEKQTQSVNSAISHFVVLPVVSDTAPPTCVLTSHPDCSGYNFNGICSTQTWSVEAKLRDIASGLYEVRAKPEVGDLQVEGLSPGTTNEVVAIHQATCCDTFVEIIGVDGQANVGKCTVDMGILGGLIYDFQVDLETETYMILHWNITASDYEIDHYDLLINQEILHQMQCKELFCVDFATYLEPCTEYAFNLTPVFDFNGSQVRGIPAYTEGVTIDKEPGLPYDGAEIDATETTITISWHAANPLCSFEFQVCFYEVDADPSSRLCEKTKDNTYTLRGLGRCRAYFSEVVAISPSGMTSPPLTFYAVTICPGFP